MKKPDRNNQAVELLSLKTKKLAPTYLNIFVRLCETKISLEITAAKCQHKDHNWPGNHDRCQ
jgi:hypothetical protein